MTVIVRGFGDGMKRFEERMAIHDSVFERSESFEAAMRQERRVWNADEALAPQRGFMK